MSMEEKKKNVDRNNPIFKYKIFQIFIWTFAINFPIAEIKFFLNVFCYCIEKIFFFVLHT